MRGPRTVNNKDQEDTILKAAHEQSKSKYSISLKRYASDELGALSQYRKANPMWLDENDRIGEWQKDTPKVTGVGGVTVATYETQGHRPRQEDQFLAMQTQGKKSPEDVRDFLTSIFKKTAAEIEKEGASKSAQHVGSTANVVYICNLDEKKKSIITANAGDSRAVLITVDKSGNAKAERLSCDHTPSDKRERARISNAGGMVREKRLCYDNGKPNISVSRGFGDLDTKGVSAEPEISHKEITMQDGCKYYLVQTCDGMFEHLHEGNLAAITKDLVKKSNDKAVSSETLAKAFVCAAFNSGSGDNITCNVAEITKEQTNDVVIGVFDGHGGAEVAKFAKSAMETYIGKGLDAVVKPLSKFAAEEKAHLAKLKKHRPALEEKQAQQSKENMVLRLNLENSGFISM